LFLYKNILSIDSSKNTPIKITSIKTEMIVSDELGCNIEIREIVTYKMDYIIKNNIRITKVLDFSIQSIKGLILETQTAQIKEFYYHKSENEGIKLFVFTSII